MKFISIPSIQCPICLDDLSKVVSNDKSRIIFEHPKVEYCYDSGIRIIKSLTDFIVEL